jgi:hypothetical protein
MQTKVEHVMKISQNISQIKEDINQSTLNQAPEIVLDSDIITGQICDIIVPKIQAIISNLSNNQNANEDSMGKRTLLVHSHNSPNIFYGNKGNENFNAMNFQDSGELNSGPFGFGLRSTKNVTAYYDLMGMIFKISSTFVNLIAELIPDLSYYEDMRLEVVK